MRTFDKIETPPGGYAFRCINERDRMEDRFDIATLLSDPLIALINAADGVDHQTFVDLLAQANRCLSEADGPALQRIDAGADSAPPIDD